MGIPGRFVRLGSTWKWEPLFTSWDEYSPGRGKGKDAASVYRELDLAISARVFWPGSMPTLMEAQAWYCTVRHVKLRFPANSFSICTLYRSQVDILSGRCTYGPCPGLSRLVHCLETTYTLARLSDTDVRTHAGCVRTSAKREIRQWRDENLRMSLDGVTYARCVVSWYRCIVRFEVQVYDDVRIVAQSALSDDAWLPQEPQSRDTLCRRGRAQPQR